MRREIKFKGKRLDNGEWLYGDLMQCGTHVHICDHDNPEIDFLQTEVDPDTVGQFTGFHDIDNVEIYEGDICTVQNSEQAVVKWQMGGFHLMCTVEDASGRHSDFSFSGVNRIKVIGNIHDSKDTDQ